MSERLYDADWVGQSCRRLAREIAAEPREAPLALVGVRTRGAILAERLCALLREDGVEADLGFLDTTMYRDDLHRGGGLKEIKATEIDFPLDDRPVVLVDDVLATGRTARAALDALFGFGRPLRLRFAVMLDRGGRELPIQPDHLGAGVEVPPGGRVRLRLREIDGFDGVDTLAPGEKDPA